MADLNGWTPPSLKQVQKLGKNIISFNVEKFQYTYYVNIELNNSTIRYIRQLTLFVKFPSGKDYTFKCPIVLSDSGYYEPQQVEIETNETGEYLLRFNLEFEDTKTTAGVVKGGIFSAVAIGYFSISAEQKTAPYTIKQVIDRTLSLTPTRRVRDKNKYVFRNNAEEYATEESPEFTFTGKHLFEAMLDVASYKKKFPALYRNEIYFRPYYNGKRWTSADLPLPIKAVLNSTIDQYCTALDSYVENMVCVNDSMVGTVVEPYRDGYITARSGSGSEISESTAMIPTQSGIYQSIDLLMGTTKDETIGSIQAYVYEQEEYDSLSDTSAAYPYSKSYAVKFNRFEKNITELGYRRSTSSSWSDAWEKPAISNIACAKLGEDVGMSVREYLSAFIGDGTAAPFADLLFQPTYIPVVNARVRQYKPMFDEDKGDSTLFYNQQAEVVDSEAFGENVKGLIQKLGNHVEIRVYRFARIDDVPTVGTMVDDKIVYDATMTIFENHVDATLCFVDYAELSKFIGVKNEIKTSDISSTKWCNRFINWEEFFVFTQQNISGDSISISRYALEGMVAFTDTDSALSCVAFTCYSNDGIKIVDAYAPIRHLALGNSVYFQWSMLDNYAVGQKSEKAPSGATSAWTGTKYDRAQKAVRYCDVYGTAKTIDFSILRKGPTLDNSELDLTSVPIIVTLVDNIVTVSLQRESGLYLRLHTIAERIDGSNIIRYNKPLDFGPSDTIKKYTHSDVTLSNAYLANVELIGDTEESRKAFYLKVGHSYPEKPQELTLVEKPRFSIQDLLIDKNSAEALTFAAQYHFRQTWREFVIGSGMSNFCALIGGSCEKLILFVSIFPLSRFDRHINLDENKDLVLSELPEFTVEPEKKRIKISLPESINRTGFLSWGLAGKDRHGNYQLIFGENKKGREDFNTTIYLVARKKNNEPQSRVTNT